MASQAGKCSEIAKTCTFSFLRKASRTISQVYDEALAPCGLTGVQFTILIGVALGEEITVSRLANVLVMDRTTLTRDIGPLQREGLIRVVQGKDARTRVLTLTAKGKDLLSNAVPLWDEAQLQIKKTLGEKRWKNLMSGLSEAVSLLRRT